LARNFRSSGMRAPHGYRQQLSVGPYIGARSQGNVGKAPGANFSRVAGGVLRLMRMARLEPRAEGDHVRRQKTRARTITLITHKDLKERVTHPDLCATGGSDNQPMRLDCALNLFTNWRRRAASKPLAMDAEVREPPIVSKRPHPPERSRRGFSPSIRAESFGKGIERAVAA